ncbi:hypothetical protein Tco_1033663 [Tanacetum coccineum]
MEGPSTPLVSTPVVSNPQKEPEQNPETSTKKVQNPNLENTAHVPPSEEEDSIFIEIPKLKAKKTVNIEIQDLNSSKPNSYPSKLPYPERMKVRENDKPIQQMVKLIAKEKEKLKEIAITTVNAECSAIIMNKVPEKLEDLGKFLIPCLIDLYEETLTLRVEKEELVYYADKSEKNKNKHCVHAISVIDFSKDDPFSGSTTTHSDDPYPSSSPVMTSDNVEKFANELAPLDSLPPGNDDLIVKKDLQENVEIKNSNEPVLLNTPLSDKVKCFAPEDNNDEIDDFLAMEVSSNLEEGYFDLEGDIAFLDNLLSDDDSHNLASKVSKPSFSDITP